MRVEETVSQAPISVERSVRGDEIRGLTSCRAGKIVPLAFFPVLREDQLNGRLNIRFRMAETVHPLANAVNVVVHAHFVPYSAFARFQGMDELNRSYKGIPEAHNSQVIPFVQTINFDKAAALWKTLGVHWKQGTPINSAVVEAYNTLVNFRRKARSKSLAQRTLTDTTLAAAFWRNPLMWHIVPDYESALLDGDVALSFTQPKVPVSGVGGWKQGGITIKDALGNAIPTPLVEGVRNDNASGVQVAHNASNVAQVFAEMASAGAKVSLANLKLAEKTAAFAKLREQYKGWSEDHLIGLLMSGIRVPDEALREPVLLARESTVFGYSERHATDGASLAKSVTTGETALSVPIRLPATNVGGVVLVTCEIVPEQLFERIRDRFLGITGPAQFPDFLRDYLDPDKVEVVQNQYVDVEHGVPTGTFGYAPLNHAWKRSFARIGGRYYRPNPDTFIEDRQRFWSVEKLNPALNTDFYLVGDLPHTVFADSAADPFEILTLGSVSIVGNTVFGEGLKENDGNYAAVDAVVDKTRVVQS